MIAPITKPDAPIPAKNMAVADELRQHALGQQRVGQVQPGEFVLVWFRWHRQLVEQPFVERPVVLEFQRADRMRNAFNGVRLAVGIVVARIDRPFGASARVLGMANRK